LRSSFQIAHSRESALPDNKKGDLRVPFFRATCQANSGLARLLDPITLEALGAHPNTLDRAVDAHPHGLQVRIPPPLGSIVGVADVVAGDRPFRAERAYPCHKLHPLTCSERGKPLNLASNVV
jgi:hypothetical protein